MERRAPGLPSFGARDRQLTREHALGGTVSTQITEEIARGYYTRWASYMRGAGWDELLGADDGVARRAAE